MKKGYDRLSWYVLTLLVLMLAQIVYTTLAYLRLGQLQVEPVLVVGIIAVVRRILVVTAATELAGRDASFESLSRGALDLLPKPTAWPATDDERAQ